MQSSQNDLKHISVHMFLLLHTFLFKPTWGDGDTGEPNMFGIATKHFSVQKTLNV